MARQTRSLRVGERNLRIPVAGKSSTKAVIPNYGVTELTTDFTAGDWVLDKPYVGARKTLYSVSATTGLVVRGSTGTSVTFTSTGATQIRFDGAGDKCVELYGRSTSEWVVTSVVPVSTALIISAS